MGKVEILLATYNGGKFLGELLDSVFAQTYQNFSLLIRDDGSEDDTIQIIEEYALKYPGKIFLLNDSVLHRGATLSFAYLIENSSEEYLMLCDQDDVWLNNKIEVTMNSFKKLESENPGIPLMVFTDLTEVDDNLILINESFIHSQKLFPEVVTKPVQILSLNVVAGCTMMFNKTSKKFILPIPASYIIHDQWIAINISYFGQIKYVPVTTILYRQHHLNAVGANKIGLKYFITKVLNPSKQLKIYSCLIKNLKFKVNWFSFFYYKMYFTFKRL